MENFFGFGFPFCQEIPLPLNMAFPQHHCVASPFLSQHLLTAEEAGSYCNLNISLSSHNVVFFYI